MQGDRDKNMNIVIFGAGAVGSLFGALLSKKNNVSLVGRTSHVNAIRKNGLNIRGITQLNVKIPAENSVDNVTVSPDILILTVKSYDTESAINQAKKIINEDTIVLSLQNGLDNVDKIKKVVDHKNITAGVTTHGVIFSKPGIIVHTGKGYTVLGELDGTKTERIKHVVSLFNEASIETKISTDILREIWVKAIINSSINPLTTFFQCKNGYLLENPLLENIVEKTCKESALIAKANGVYLSHQDMYKKTRDVIQNTAENYSSMLQSFKRGRKTEIESINGRIVEVGRKQGMEMPMNETLVYLVKSVCEK